MRFRHRLVGAWWQEEQGHWKLRFEVTDANGQSSGYETEAEVLINGSGNLK
jgi:hypothetical protein